jgi:predicted RNA-binding protein Jag
VPFKECKKTSSQDPSNDPVLAEIQKLSAEVTEFLESLLAEQFIGYRISKTKQRNSDTCQNQTPRTPKI